MKKLSILFAVIALALNVAVANTNTVDPSAKAKAEVKIENNGFNFIKVWVDKVDDAKVRIKIYDNDFTLLHTETLKEVKTKGFDISKLKKGHYIVKVTLNGETIHTEAIEKIK